jgi:hypothetical protein
MAQDFGQGLIEFGRDEISQIQFKKNLDEVPIGVDGDSLLSGDREDLFCNRTASLGQKTGGGILSLKIAKSHSQLPV